MQDQVLCSQCVTQAMKPDSDLRENEYKPRVNYSPDLSSSVQPNMTAPTYLPPLPPTNTQENLYQKASLCHHLPGAEQSMYLLAALTNRLFRSNTKKIIFLSRFLQVQSLPHQLFQTIPFLSHRPVHNSQNENRS